MSRVEIVIAVFVFAGQETVIAIMAFCDIDDQVPLVHNVSPSNFATSTRHELGAIPLDFLVIKRLGVKMLIHPAISADSPGFPRGT